MSESRSAPAAVVAARARAQEAQHAASSSRLRRMLGAFHFSGVFWYRFHLFGVRVLPRALVSPLISAIAFGFYCALGGVRRALMHNLSWVLEPAPATWLQRHRGAWKTVRNLAWCLTETYEGLASAGPPQVMSIEGRRTWDRLHESERGFVVVTAHLGHWEIGSRVHRTERRVNVVREPEMDPRAQDFLGELLRRKVGDRVVFHYAGGSDFALGTRLLAVLRRGEIVALQGDRPSRGGRCCTVSLFGKPLEVPIGPAVLARLAEVPLVPVFVLRDGRASSLALVRDPITVRSDVPRDEAFSIAMQTFADELQSAIRLQPHQWFVFTDLWGQRPPGTAASPDSRDSAGRDAH